MSDVEKKPQKKLMRKQIKQRKSGRHGVKVKKEETSFMKGWVHKKKQNF